MITYSTENVSMPKIRRRDVSKWIKSVAETYGMRVGEIGYLFCDDEKILEVNREYLQHDYYTDIITFDYCDDDTINGDLVISLDTVRSNAEQFGKDYEETVERRVHEKELEESSGLTEDLNPDIKPSEQEEQEENSNE